MEITRNFTHSKTETDFGTVKIEFPTDGFVLDGKELPEASVRAIVNQGLQILQDTYAGVGASKTVDEAKAAFTNKLEALYEGTVGERRGGGSVEPHVPYVRRVIRGALTGKNKAAYDAIPSDEQAKRIELLDKLFAGLDEAKQAKVVEMAKTAMEADRKAKAAAKAATEGFSL